MIPTDQLILNKAKKKLIGNKRLSSQPIDIKVYDGKVTLSGNVQSHRRKLAAYEIVSSTEGCRYVVNNLIVKPSETIANNEVAENVRKALEVHADVAKEAIVVRVESGIATLSGCVASPWERLIADDVARSALGVRDVMNDLVIDPVSVEQDVDICKYIEESLEETEGLTGTNIRVATHKGSIVLSGSVKRLWQREKAEIVARGFEPMDLKNKIIVEPESGSYSG